MKFSVRFALCWVLALLAMTALGQIPTPATWTGGVMQQDVRAGEVVDIVLNAKISPPWHIYGLKPSATEGPLPTTITIDENKFVSVAGDAVEPTPDHRFDPNFNINVDLHEGEAKFHLPIRIDPTATGTVNANVSVSWQACNNHECARPQTTKLPISIKISPGAARKNLSASAKGVFKMQGADLAPPGAKAAPANDAKSQGLLAFVWLAFSAGLLALITPCVFPMIPITVSFFTKKAGDDRKVAVRDATAYSLGIITSFTIVGLAVTLIFGASGLQKLATNPFVNFGLAALFIVLALSLFGVFELSLPQGFVNKAQSGTQRGGWIAPVLMGVTFSLTTFTCTVPFVGTLLIAATQGDIWYPLLGMLAFSTAFALPFFLLAMFPQFLSRLPKSGSWLVTTKAFMGFLELAAALKFLSNIDLVYGWGLITRPVFLAIWAIIMTLSSLFLAGWVTLGHHAKSENIGIARRCFALLSIASAVYCLAGIQGANLGQLGSFLPPEPYPGKIGMAEGGLMWEESYAKALAQAKAEGKPLFIDFTGVTCTNCRQMEQQVFPKSRVQDLLKTTVRAKLFTDRGDKDQVNIDLQTRLTQSTTLPVYVVLDPRTEKVLGTFSGSTFDVDKFASFLSDGIRALPAGSVSGK